MNGVGDGESEEGSVCVCGGDGVCRNGWRMDGCRDVRMAVGEEGGGAMGEVRREEEGWKDG